MDFSTETITILRQGGDSWPDTLQNPPHFKTCLKSAKNLYLSHRFFYKIRQIHRIFDAFRQNPPILCRNQAPSRCTLVSCRLAPSPPRAAPAPNPPRPPGEKSVHSQHFRTRNPASTRNGCRVEITLYLYALTCTRRSLYQQRRRSRPCQSFP